MTSRVQSLKARAHRTCSSGSAGRRAAAGLASLQTAARRVERGVAHHAHGLYHRQSQHDGAVRDALGQRVLRRVAARLLRGLGSLRHLLGELSRGVSEAARFVRRLAHLDHQLLALARHIVGVFHLHLAVTVLINNRSRSRT